MINPLYSDLFIVNSIIYNSLVEYNFYRRALEILFEIEGAV